MADRIARSKTQRWDASTMGGRKQAENQLNQRSSVPGSAANPLAKRAKRHKTRQLWLGLRNFIRSLCSREAFFVFSGGHNLSSSLAVSGERGKRSMAQPLRLLRLLDVENGRAGWLILERLPPLPDLLHQASMLLRRGVQNRLQKCASTSLLGPPLG